MIPRSGMNFWHWLLSPLRDALVAVYRADRLRHDAVLDIPAFGRIAEIAVAADLFRFTGEAGQGGVLDERADLAQ
jgi:hypothetical protein